mgnify:CR=1 FL=1
MTAKEKAQDLLNKFDSIIYTDKNHDRQVKECAIILVDEMIIQFTDKCCESANRRFWEEVKQEINKL